ncbi:hypothetical protein K523DRAFT_109559 [Schizophyllum commune Tattone D]|nr:hypothetical protein K523DRAFT_109559 [Schizophyllum commune Tattone D]
MTAATSSSRSWRGSCGMGMSICRRHLVALNGPSTSTTADTTTSWNINVGWRVRHRCRPRPQASPEGAALVLRHYLPSSLMLLFVQAQSLEAHTFHSSPSSTNIHNNLVVYVRVFSLVDCDTLGIHIMRVSASCRCLCRSGVYDLALRRRRRR